VAGWVLAKKVHLPALGTLPRARTVALCIRAPLALKPPAASAEFTRISSDFEALLADPGIAGLC